jgi:hypothetical protein
MLNRVATMARGGPTRPNLDLALTLAGAQIVCLSWSPSP